METIYYNLFTKKIYKLSDTVYKFDKFILKLDENRLNIYLSNITNDKYNDRSYEIYFESLYFTKFNKNILKTIKYFLKTYKKYRE